MNSATIQDWQSSYLCIAFLVAVTTTVVAHHARVGDPPARSTRVAAAGLLGLLWPLTLLGLAQFWAISAIAKRMRSAPRAETAPAFILAGGPN